MSHLPAVALFDQYRTLLRKSIIALSTSNPETVPNILAGLEKDFHEADDMGEKLYAHAAIVGILSIMIEEIQEHADAEEASGEGHWNDLCIECGVNPADHKGICEGCYAYREHQQ
jgi:hypothetical protein